jgi:hypothetical protein
MRGKYMRYYRERSYRYYAEWEDYLEWTVVDLLKDKVLVSGVSQSTAKFTALVLNLRGEKDA